MSSPIEALILDLVEWVARAPRRYRDVIAVWGTSCPRLTVWEDTVELGWVATEGRTDGEIWVIASPAGREALRQAGRLRDVA